MGFQSQAPRLPRAPEQTVVFAVGDIHGRLDLAERVTHEIAAAQASRGQKAVVAVFLGDYIDKGPNAAGVLAHLIAFRDRRVCRTHFLRGNHEQVLLDLVDGEERSARWLEYGGDETLASYGLSGPALPARCDAEQLRRLALSAVPQDHLAFLRETEFYVQFGDYILVHAGLRPDRLLEEQSDADMLWFRYYDDEAPVWPQTVVHGHSPNPRPVLGRARIGIDTEAYASDALTVLRLEDDRQDFLKVQFREGRIDVGAWDATDSAYSRTGGEPRLEPEGEPKLEAPRRLEPATPKRGRVLMLAGAAGVVLAALLLARPVGALIEARSQATAQASQPALRPNAAVAPLSVRETLRPAAAAPEPAPPPPVEAAPVGPGLATAPAPAAPDAAWAQIGALPSEAAAQATWRDLTSTAPRELETRALRVEAAEVGGKTFYRANVTGFASLDEAKRFCGRLAAMGRACLPRKAG